MWGAGGALLHPPLLCPPGLFGLRAAFVCTSAALEAFHAKHKDNLRSMRAESIGYMYFLYVRTKSLDAAPPSGPSAVTTCPAISRVQRFIVMTTSVRTSLSPTA